MSLDPGKVVPSSSFGRHFGSWTEQFLLDLSILGELI